MGQTLINLKWKLTEIDRQKKECIKKFLKDSHHSQLPPRSHREIMLDLSSRPVSICQTCDEFNNSSQQHHKEVHLQTWLHTAARRLLSLDGWGQQSLCFWQPPRSRPPAGLHYTLCKIYLGKWSKSLCFWQFDDHTLLNRFDVKVLLKRRSWLYYHNYTYIKLKK